MRNISFALTTKQFLDGSKTVTRRCGWWRLKPGDRMQAVRKAMGLKKGEKVKVLGVIEIVSTVAEPLAKIHRYGPDETAREGFPELSAEQFIEFFIQHMPKATRETLVNRIEFKRIS